MSIITKANSPTKGVATLFTLNKTELSDVVEDIYYSETLNWARVIVKYRSSVGNQTESVVFDATLESPTANFLVSQKAFDIFEVLNIYISDFDNGTFVVPRSQLNTSEFDVDMSIIPALLTRDFSIPIGSLGFESFANAGVISGGTFNVLYGTGDGQGTSYTLLPTTFTYGPTYTLRLTLSGAVSSNFLISTSGQYPPRAVTSQEISQGYIEFTWLSDGYGSISFYFGSTDGSNSTAQFSKIEVFPA